MDNLGRVSLRGFGRRATFFILYGGGGASLFFAPIPRMFVGLPVVQAARNRTIEPAKAPRKTLDIACILTLSITIFPVLYQRRDEITTLGLRIFASAIQDYTR
jgi:hypothetical protein